MKKQLDEVKKLQKLAGIINESDFPEIGKTINAADLDYDTVDYFNRTNRKLIVTLKNGEKVESTVGLFYQNLIFHGKFPEDIQNKDYSIQKKYFDTIEIVG